MTGTEGMVRAYIAKKAILELLVNARREMSTPQIREAVCTPREQLFGPNALPYERQIWSTTVYPCLTSLAKEGKVARRQGPCGSRDVVWWWAVDTDLLPPVDHVPSGIEAVDLDALLDSWRTET